MAVGGRRLSGAGGGSAEAARGPNLGDKRRRYSSGQRQPAGAQLVLELAGVRLRSREPRLEAGALLVAKLQYTSEAGGESVLLALELLEHVGQLEPHEHEPAEPALEEAAQLVLDRTWFGCHHGAAGEEGSISRGVPVATTEKQNLAGVARVTTL